MPNLFDEFDQLGPVVKRFATTLTKAQIEKDTFFYLKLVNHTY